jgi:drug/metabolite transporter (DMT)-like permease
MGRLLPLPLSLMWGGSFFFIGVAVKALPPFTIVAARVSIAATLLRLAAAFSTKARPTGTLSVSA